MYQSPIDIIVDTISEQVAEMLRTMLVESGLSHCDDAYLEKHIDEILR